MQSAAAQGARGPAAQPHCVMGRLVASGLRYLGVRPMIQLMITVRVLTGGAGAGPEQNQEIDSASRSSRLRSSFATGEISPCLPSLSQSSPSRARAPSPQPQVGSAAQRSVMACLS